MTRHHYHSIEYYAWSYDGRWQLPKKSQLGSRTYMQGTTINTDTYICRCINKINDGMVTTRHWQTFLKIYNVNYRIVSKQLSDNFLEKTPTILSNYNNNSTRVTHQIHMKSKILCKVQRSLWIRYSMNCVIQIYPVQKRMGFLEFLQSSLLLLDELIQQTTE